MHWLPLLQGEQIADLLGLAAPSLHASLYNYSCSYRAAAEAVAGQLYQSTTHWTCFCSTQIPAHIGHSTTQRHSILSQCQVEALNNITKLGLLIVIIPRHLVCKF